MRALRSVVRFALDAGAHGVVFPGVASEYNFLSVEERGDLMSVAIDEVGGRVPIIGGVTSAESSAYSGVLMNEHTSIVIALLRISRFIGCRLSSSLASRLVLPSVPPEARCRP